MKRPRGGSLSVTRLEREARVIRALAHPQRLAICELLLCGRSSVGELADQIGLKHSVVSQHLGKMRAYGIVTRRRQGQLVFYEVTDPIPKRVFEGIRERPE